MSWRVADAATSATSRACAACASRSTRRSSRLRVRLDLLLERAGQGGEVLGRHRGAARRGHEAETLRRPDHRQPLLARLRLEALDRVVLVRPQLLQDPGRVALERLALERAREARPALVDQPRHLGAEFAAAARRELERRRTVRVREVVDVAPVGRRRLRRGARVQHAAHGRRLPGARGAQDEEVVAGTPHRDAERRRGDGALLTDHAIRRRELRGRREAERRRVADRAELAGLEGARH
jgi:hypothetical protein